MGPFRILDEELLDCLAAGPLCDDWPATFELPGSGDGLEIFDVDEEPTSFGSPRPR